MSEVLGWLVAMMGAVAVAIAIFSLLTGQCEKQARSAVAAAFGRVMARLQEQRPARRRHEERAAWVDLTPARPRHGSGRRFEPDRRAIPRRRLEDTLLSSRLRHPVG